MPRDRTATLGEGELLLLYTDGLVEDRVDQLDVGPGRLLGRAGQAFDPPDGDSSGKASLAEGLLSAVFAGVDEDHADDVAVLAVLREPGRSPAGNRPADAAVATLDVHLTYPAQLDAAARMRQDLRRPLAEAAVPADVADDVLIAASEAVNNALEHAQDPRRPQVDVHLGLGADTLALQVRDHAPGWPGGRAWTGVTGRPS